MTSAFGLGYYEESDAEQSENKSSCLNTALHLLLFWSIITKFVMYMHVQAVIKQISGSGYESSDVMVIDEVEMQRHQQLEQLYRSTRAGRVRFSPF